MYVCPVCGASSAHPDDERYGYCGRCQAFTRDRAPAKGRAKPADAAARLARRRNVGAAGRLAGPVDEPDVARAPDVDDE